MQMDCLMDSLTISLLVSVVVQHSGVQKEKNHTKYLISPPPRSPPLVDGGLFPLHQRHTDVFWFIIIIPFWTLFSVTVRYQQQRPSFHIFQQTKIFVSLFCMKILNYLRMLDWPTELPGSAPDTRTFILIMHYCCVQSNIQKKKRKFRKGSLSSGSESLSKKKKSTCQELRNK